MIRRIFVCTLAVLALTGAYASDTPTLEQRVIEHTFSNGIKLLVLERHFSPTVSIRMMFRTGSVDEVSGKTGLAHMFEHMMFKGTKTLGTRDYAKELPLLKQIDGLHQQLDQEKSKGALTDPNRVSTLLEKVRAVEAQAAPLVVENELWNLYEREGASELNAGTSRDFTQYVVDLPSNKLELWAILDSDRVRNPVFRQFYQERDVVQEERRMRVETAPEGKLYEEFLSTAYTAHPYRHPTIGWDSDISHLTVADLEDFYRRYYTPDHLTIAVVGDVTADQVIRLVDRYFGSWRVPPAPASNITQEPPQTGLKEFKIRFDAQPHLLMGFHIPGTSEPERVTYYAIAQLLGSGTSSRFYKILVEKKKLASAVDVSEDDPGERYDPLLTIAAAPRHPHTAQDVVEAIWKELDRLKNEPVQEWELEKLRAGVDVMLLNALQTNDGMAGTLVYDQTIFGDWRTLLRFQKLIHGLTPQAIQAAAKKSLTRENETLGILESVKKQCDTSRHPRRSLAGDPSCR
ncbi:MAG: pitrilysin family protein [Elusimicrobiota bacterium]|jgi:predicted Zn-dependent peptidase